MEIKVRSCLDSLAVYQPGKPIEEVKRELGLEDIVKLASNENPLGPSPRAMAAVAAAVSQMNFYPDGSAYRLRAALAARLGVEFDAVIVGNGSNELVQMLSLALLEPGDEVVMPVPTFPRYEPLARLMGAVPVEVPLKDFRIDIEAMAARVGPKTKMIYLCNPNNPTGTIATRQEVDWLLERLDPAVLVVFDEAYFEYVTHPDYPDGLDYYRRGYNVMVLRTFSKMYGLAGLRVGYGVGSPRLVGYLNRVREPFNVNALAQEAALAALEDEEFVTLTKKTNEEGKRFLYQAFGARGIPYVPTEANFIFFDAGRDERVIFRRMLAEGVIIRGGFGYPTHLRVTIGTAAQNARFVAAIEKVLAE
ncbi:histidinol-phosphate aminotransferase [Thermodesulfitimonas autotrophica]|uniref:Histidinol-phosphate aminotransferase n=1 Tax=Thermodesulfitimonas autotrophica TaxID=1894989 RepID=A0A3N5AEE2_9THEO|nr:histidinol-phosphate transaminase [Thermodesulfitimonas autotrophica]RPF43017.1 histidinol-phosphate aminotransferase [Thermodesulfitimonas autotrophica]